MSTQTDRQVAKQILADVEHHFMTEMEKVAKGGGCPTQEYADSIRFSILITVISQYLERERRLSAFGLSFSEAYLVNRAIASRVLTLHSLADGRGVLSDVKRQALSEIEELTRLRERLS